MKIREHIAMTRGAENALAYGFRRLARRHSQNSEVYYGALRFARWSGDLARLLEPYAVRYGKALIHPPERAGTVVFQGLPVGGFGLLRDLQDAALLASRSKTLWLGLGLAAQALKDREFEALCARADEQAQRAVLWLQTQIRVTAPQALTVKAKKTAEIKASIPLHTPRAAQLLLWGGIGLASGLAVLAGIASFKAMASPGRGGSETREKGVPRRAPLSPRG